MMQERATVERVHCQERLWIAGAMRPCGQTVAVRTWTSHGRDVTACSRHEAEVRHRYPETAPTTIHEAYHDEQPDPDCGDCRIELANAFGRSDWTEGELRVGWGK